MAAVDVVYRSDGLLDLQFITEADYLAAQEFAQSRVVMSVWASGTASTALAGGPLLRRLRS